MSEEVRSDELTGGEREERDGENRITGFGTFPLDWEKKDIVECAEIRDSERIPLNSKEREEKKPGDIPYYGANGVLDYIDEYIFDSELILLAEDGGHFEEYQKRPVAYRISGKSWVNNHAHILEARDGTVTDYLFYSLEHRNLVPYVSGSTRSKLTQSMLRKVKIPSPPLPEQRKIAAVLHTVDRAIEKTEEIVKQSNRVKNGLIQQFYSRGYYDHQEWQQVDMQDAYVMARTDELPAAWNIKQSGDIAEVKTGHTPSTSVDEYWDGEISWVDIHDLTQLEGTVIHSTDDTITEEGLNNSGAKLLPKETLVLCRTGAIGETAILGKEMATDQDQVTFECDESEVLPRYLMYLFEYATPQLERLSAGSTHDKVQLHFFSDLEIPLPEIDEQREIVDVLESVDEVSQANKKQLDHLHRVKQGLMQDLLSGKVRTTDTNIEVPEEITQHG